VRKRRGKEGTKEKTEIRDKKELTSLLDGRGSSRGLSGLWFA